MSWGQEVQQIFAILGWWWVIAIFFCVVVLGILSSTVLVYLVSRFILKDPMKYTDVFRLLLINKRKVSGKKPVGTMPIKRSFQFNFSPILQVGKIRDVILQSIKKITPVPHTRTPVDKPGFSHVDTQPSPQPESDLNPRVNDLIDELDNNLNIIKNSKGNKLSPLQTKARLTHLFSNKLSTELESLLEELYIDISFWNNMVYVSGELNRQIDFSNERYQKSLSGISDRIQTIKKAILKK